jgi:hypothetical protein
MNKKISNKGFAISTLLYPAFIIIITIIVLMLGVLISSVYSIAKMANEVQGDVSDNNTMKSLKSNLTDVLNQITDTTVYSASNGTIVPALSTTSNVKGWTGKFYNKSDGTKMAYIDNGVYCAYKIEGMSGVAVYNSGDCVKKMADQTDCTQLADLVGASAKTIFLSAHPVGSIYITTSETESTKEQMETAYGGTWEAFGAGRTLVGNGSGTDSNNTTQSFTASSNNTGGAYSHNHLYGFQYYGYYHVTVLEGSSKTGVLEGGNGSLGPTIVAGNDTIDVNSSSTTAYNSVISNLYRSTANTSNGSSLQPYVVVYMWKRTA